MRTLGCMLVFLLICGFNAAYAQTAETQTMDTILDSTQETSAAVSAPHPAAPSATTVPTALQGKADMQPTPSPLQAAPVADHAPELMHNLSPIGMYNQAHFVVKGVMLGLLVASIATWTILFAKALELWLAKRKMRETLDDVTGAESLAALVQRVDGNKSLGAHMVRMVEREVRVSLGALESAGNAGLKERLSSLLGRVEIHAGRRMARGTAIIATIGSIGPFVGLFGTVWGIMNSFIGIAQAKTTNLAVVAPGIAEALLATAIGLAAAIPAVVIYNILVRWIGSYRQTVADCSAGIERLVSRDLDMLKVHRGVAQRMDFAAE